MKISLDWLGDFIDWKEKDLQTIADRLTLGTAEVEAVQRQGTLLDHCCAGKVLSVGKHPNADKLCIVEVETDKGAKRVVCGGTNLQEGMLVAFAHVGATVKWHGGELMTLAPVKIRGEASEGMICAAEELGLEEMIKPLPEDGERPIVNLSRLKDAKLKAGMPLREALGLTDTILVFSNTALTNRPDLFSHVGFARECVALGLATWKKKKARKLPAFPKKKLPFGTDVKVPELVKRYCACLVEIDGEGETPDWMKRRLEAVGWRPLSLAVDITNYVATETGMPLHSFDADDIQGKVLFRLAQPGEKIVTLDKVERDLPSCAIILSDDAGVFDLMGIMGGLRSSTKSSSRRLYLHSAIIDPTHIRRTVNAMSHRTDAATVYEKGIPPITARMGFERALELMLELLPGARVASELEEWGDEGSAKAIDLPLEQLQASVGVEISAKDAAKILESLECEVKTKKTGKSTTLSVTPPLHRLRDLRIPADIVEEVARIHGYDRLPEIMPHAPMRIPARDGRIHRVREALKADGFFEILPLNLLGAQLLEKSGMNASEAVKIANPLGEDMALMQTSTLPGLLQHAEKNLLLSDGELRTFHWGHVFHAKEKEHAELSLLAAAKAETGLHDDPFLRLKQTVVHMLKEAGYDASFAPAKNHPAYAHPGRHASLSVNGKTVGSVFELHPSVRERFGMEHRAAAANVNVSELLEILPETRMAKPVPGFPAISYDVTLPWTQSKRVGELLLKLRGHSKLLEGVEVADLYHGKQQKPDEYNLTLRFTYRADDRTLTEDEAKKEHESLLKQVA